ncbi:uncharacterized protein G2W53_041422 [Senna tora]|uniref:Uncharacterized protein n=1 Tax=Senna tora TaxID=362788 RepID=A0A834W1D0_9FABA|nr:uncharacterized protein G2W53_041422 [Senna tora]
MAWDERGSCLNIFRTTNRDRISETFWKYEAKALMRKNIHEVRGKCLVAQVSETSQLELYLRNQVDLMFELESSWHRRNVDLVLTYFGKVHEVPVKSLVSQLSKTGRFALCLRNRVDLMFELESSWGGRSVDLVLTYSKREIHEVRDKSHVAREEGGSCLNIFWTRNRGRISELFMKYEAKALLRNGAQAKELCSSNKRCTRPREQIGSHGNTIAEQHSARAEKQEIWVGKVTEVGLGRARQRRNREAALNDPRTAGLWQSSPTAHKTVDR